jgi:hypothetical protein
MNQKAIAALEMVAFMACPFGPVTFKDLFKLSCHTLFLLCDFIDRHALFGWLFGLWLCCFSFSLGYLWS